MPVVAIMRTSQCSREHPHPKIWISESVIEIALLSPIA
jgi:hypothetical protein